MSAAWSPALGTKQLSQQQRPMELLRMAAHSSTLHKCQTSPNGALSVCQVSTALAIHTLDLTLHTSQLYFMC